MVEDLLRLPFDLVGERLHVVRATQRVGDVGHVGLLGDHLLRPEGDRRRLLGGQGQGLVEGVGVERLGASEHR